MTQPLADISVLFSHAWKTLKARYATLASISVLSSIAMPIGAMAIIFICAIPAVAVGMAAGMESIAFQITAGICAVLAAIAAFCLNAFFASALLDAAAHKAQPTFDGAFKAAKADWKMYAWFSLVLLVFVLGFYGLFLIPALIFFPALALAPFVFKAEGLRGAAAFVRARDLVVGRWWSVFVRLLIAHFIVGIVPAFLMAMRFASIKINMKDGVPDLESLAPMAGAGTGFIQGIYMTLFATPFVLAFVGQLYHDLVATQGAVQPTKGRTWKYGVIAGLGWFVVAAILAVSMYAIVWYVGQMELIQN